MLGNLGKVLAAAGVFLLMLGLALWGLGRLGFSFRHFPGDIYFQRKNFVFYFPLGLSLALSVILTIVLSFFSRK